MQRLALLFTALMVVVLATGCSGKDKPVSAAPVNLVGQPGVAQTTPIPEMGGIGDRRESELVGVTLISVRRMSEIYGREPVNFMVGAGESDFIVLDLLFDYKGNLKTFPCAGGRLLDESGQNHSGGMVSEMFPGHRGDISLFPGDVYRVYATYSVPKAIQGQFTWECSVGISAPLRFRFEGNGGESGLRPTLPPLSGEGRAFQMGGVQVGALGVSREAQQTQSVHYARPGAQWVTVEISLENVTDQSPKGYQPGDFYLTDNNGFRYPRHVLAPNQLQLRPLFPGDALRGKLVFDVNDTAAGLVLNYGSPGQPVVRIGLD